mmetsp:Transcript_15954/g.34528  ORF Transcript_15954/g.34528 Transcript_15954/m.34528 type:complete len:366 (-) Transcript_15954:190-1287(-)
MDGQAHQHVQFHGCKVIRLQVGGFREDERVMPPLLTIAGPCYYTKEDKKDFEIMMRTHQQSLLMHVPPNGEFDWPDYHAFETCPGCCVRAKPGSGNRYWLLFQPIIQNFENNEGTGIGIRMVCRLTCEECFESMTEENYIQVMRGGELVEDIPLLDVVEDQGPITWLRDGKMSVRSVDDGVCMNAYTLYGAWEHSGTWQALCDEFAGAFHNLSSSHFGDAAKLLLNKPKDPSTFWEMDQIPVKEGRKCDGPNCPNVHGNRRVPEPGKKKGKKIRLNECLGCFETMYCSEQCQHTAWPDHKVVCKEAQRTRKEDEEKKKAQENFDQEAKMEAARASFVPLSLNPQGGGSKKKKGKKGGGKKKKGKK